VQAVNVAEVADQLYSLTPAEFTAARDERAREVRAAGQRDVAAAIKRLARPTASAWLVNQLARVAPDQMARLFEVGEALQDAQRALAGDRLRELSGLRRQAINELLPAAAQLADQAGQPASAAVLSEVRATLEAALADPEARSAVRSARLTKALAYAGIGEVDLTVAFALPAEPLPATGRAAAAGSTAPPVPPVGPAADSANRQAEADLVLRQAESAAEHAQAALAEAERRAASLAEQQQFLRRRLDHLERELGQAKAEAAQLARDAKAAERGRADAAGKLEAASRRVAEVRQRAPGSH